MKYKVQHFIDFATRGDTMQIVNFSVGGQKLMERCSHLIQAYRYFKLGRISIKLIPASTLPVDPTGLSYSDEDLQTVDPRDQLTPGLIRITNGEDIADSGIADLSDEQQERIFTTMMLDPSWYKFQLQSGFKRSAKPLFWYVGQLHQDVYPGAIFNAPFVEGASLLDDSRNTSVDAQYFNRDNNGFHIYNRHNFSDPHGFFQTGKKGRMGWMRTDALVEFGSSIADKSGVFEQAEVTPFPTCRVITMVLPKMHKTNYFYRCYVTEEVYFSGVRTFSPDLNGYIGSGIDNFVTPTVIGVSKFPSASASATLPQLPAKYNDGNWSEQ